MTASACRTRSGLIQRRIDVDLFIVSLHRLHTVAKLAAEVADPRNVRWISYRDRMFQTRDLLAAARDLHRAVHAAVDPEAFSDLHGDHPFIELRAVTRAARDDSRLARGGPLVLRHAGRPHIDDRAHSA
jgi:hypothetical protein